MPIPSRGGRGSSSVDAVRVLLDAGRPCLVDRRRWDTRCSSLARFPSEGNVDGSSSLGNGSVATQPLQENNFNMVDCEFRVPTPSLLSHSAEVDDHKHRGDFGISRSPSSSDPPPVRFGGNCGMDYTCNLVSHSGSSHDSNSIQWRLGLLEERVSRIAEELTGTKNLLDAFNPAWSKALLAEIQSKISIIETAMILQTAPASAKAANDEKPQLENVEVLRTEDVVSDRKFRERPPHVPDGMMSEHMLVESPNLAIRGPPISQNVIHENSRSPIAVPNQQPLYVDSFGSDAFKRQNSNLQDSSPAASFHHGSMQLSFEHSRSEESSVVMLNEPTQALLLEEQAEDGSLNDASPLHIADSESHRKDYHGTEASVWSVSDLVVKAAAERGEACSSFNVQRERRVEKRDGDISKPPLTDSAILSSGVCSSSSDPQDALEEVSKCLSSAEPVISFHQYLSQWAPESNSLQNFQVSPQATKRVMDGGTQGTFQPHVNKSSDTEVNSQANEGDMLRIWNEFSDDVQHGQPLLEKWADGPILKHLDGSDNSDRKPDLFKLGQTIATAGWFVCEGEGIVLAHEDGACSYHDVANMEEKAAFVRPVGMPARAWDNCWLIRAAGADGRSNKYVVGASAPCGNQAGFCVWNFEDRKVATYHSESPSNMCVGKATLYRASHLTEQGALGQAFTRISCKSMQHLKSKPVQEVFNPGVVTPNRLPPLWWYRPCGPLLASAGSSKNTMTLYDIRDGDVVTKWNIEKSFLTSDLCSPLHWRNKGKLVVCVDEGLGVWDVNSMTAHCLQNINLPGHNILALHIPNADAECSGGVWQRRSATEGNTGDGVVCSQRGLQVLDFRLPSGVAYKMTTTYDDTQCVYVNGDYIFTGVRIGGHGHRDLVQHRVIQWSFRQSKPMTSYDFPALAASRSLRQVWGSSEAVMAADSNGLCVFNVEGPTQHAEVQQGEPQVIGAHGVILNFDHASSRVLLIVRDRPATWCHWPQ